MLLKKFSYKDFPDKFGKFGDLWRKVCSRNFDAVNIRFRKKI